MTFHSFFEAATGKQPYPYQAKLAHGPEPGHPLESCLIHVPTGCGKTAAAILAWLWRRCCLIYFYVNVLNVPTNIS